VQAQTAADWEIILVNDGPDDGSAEAALAYAPDFVPIAEAALTPIYASRDGSWKIYELIVETGEAQ
jgi:glycosyltransferase involved in cell wall biosynthesis